MAPLKKALQFGLEAARDVGKVAKKAGQFDLPRTAKKAAKVVDDLAVEESYDPYNVAKPATVPAQPSLRDELTEAAAAPQLARIGDNQGPPMQTWRHGVSSIKLRRPYEEMTSTFAPAPGPPLLARREFDFIKDAPMGSLFTKLWGDRTAAGKLLTGVNDMKFEQPVNMQGGSDFTRGPQQQAEGAFWASDPGVITTDKNRLLKLQETGDPVFAAHAAMSTESGDYSSQTTNALLQMMKAGKPLTREAKEAFDLAMRSDWGKDFPAVADFPGIDNITDEWLAKAGKGRTKIAKLMDTGKFQNMGFHDVGSARKAVTEPELANVETGATGHNIVRVGPEAVRAITDPKIPHADYASQLAGGTYAGSTKPVPMEVFWSDWMKTRPPRENPSQTAYSFGRQPVVQRKTQEWLDRLMAYKASEQGKKLGLAGAIGAGLITKSEAEELFGYDA